MTEEKRASCLSCRTRKVKCDRSQPACARCIRVQSNCVYPPRRMLGRPPKNALIPSKSKIKSSVHVQQQKGTIREFIFENVDAAPSPPPTSMDKTKSIAHWFQMSMAVAGSDWIVLCKHQAEAYGNVQTLLNAFYAFYRERAQIIHAYFSSAKCTPEPPKAKFSSIHDSSYFVWSQMMRTFVQNIGRIRLQTTHTASYVLYIFCRPWEPLTTRVPAPPSIHHPLQSVPPQQATALINDFFDHNPCASMVNKTQLLHDYWHDTANPFLLAVVFGTSQYYANLNCGIPMAFWDHVNGKDHNPFLSFAYALLDTIHVKTANPSDYQGLLILSLFEGMWGSPKMGMSLLGTSYGIASILGFWDGTYQPKDPIEQECMCASFWLAYRSTTLHSFGTGASLADCMVLHPTFDFPPCNAAQSISYQHDLAHCDGGRTTSQRSFFIESWYVGSVICHFSSLVYACLPRRKVGLFDDPSSIYNDQTHYLALIRSIESIEARIYVVLDDFCFFIQQHRHQWTAAQMYMIETTYRLYLVHCRFLKPKVNLDQPYTSVSDNASTGYLPAITLEDLAWLDPSDPDLARRMSRALPQVFCLVQDLRSILTELAPGDLPWDFMLPAFETASVLLLAQRSLSLTDQRVAEAIAALLRLTSLVECVHPAARLLQQRLKSALKRVDHASCGSLWNAPTSSSFATQTFDPMTPQPSVFTQPNDAVLPTVQPPDDLMTMIDWDFDVFAGPLHFKSAHH
ncbi:hypothetical protein DM01DRAFT_1404949 [Hesseltinella vesiculosa]|uniref:Zn(2)-C6 fungal-type domain-containing protein n=1 Tax=Hesseltinella vesiculosa TaxID=101127 RepID=A0A1X2GQL7_9FUNG|nr:hypothetical protein DM01DRAFT_1404949 [Hesseltinella vesiculosa]